MIFALTSLGDPAKLLTSIQTHYPDDHLQVTTQLHLIAAEGVTAKDISDKLGITPGTMGSVIVISVAGYYGRAPTNVWEWMAAKSAPRG